VSTPLYKNEIQKFELEVGNLGYNKKNFFRGQLWKALIRLSKTWVLGI
jgi:hypothetical protein